MGRVKMHRSGRFILAAVVLVAIELGASATGVAAGYPSPFTRLLKVQDPPLSGRDVTVLQNLLPRSPQVHDQLTSGVYDADTEAAVKAFQAAAGVQVDGEVGPVTAAAVLSQLSADGYKDDGKPPSATGHLYKLHVPVHTNRSIETTATLYGANGTALFSFTVRAHGHNYAGDPAVWPNFNESIGLNSFSPDGATPTGLAEFDLNAPEGEPKFYGPYPVNRMVSGLAGNSGFLVPTLRDGILLHTGEWSQYSDWKPPMPMPNSAGCIHAYPDSILRVWKLLVAEGVTVHPNTGGKLPYPYKPQGLVSVELVD